MTIKFKDVIKKAGVSEHSDVKGKHGILAVHGGKLDSGTDQIAEYVHKNTEKDATSLYTLKAKEAKGHRVTSNYIAHTDSKHLNDVVENTRDQKGHLISIHGQNWKKHQDKVYVGGLNTGERKKVAREIRDALKGVKTEDGRNYQIIHNTKYIPKQLAGIGKTNIVNRAGNGVQVELPTALREGDKAKIVGNAIADSINKNYAKGYKGKEYISN